MVDREPFRKGDGVWITGPGDYQGHAGEIWADQRPGANLVAVSARGDGRKTFDITTDFPAEYLQPYRWFTHNDTERLIKVISQLHPDRSRLTVRTMRLADHLQMHGLQFDDPDPYTESTWRRIAVKVANGEELTERERARLDAAIAATT